MQKDRVYTGSQPTYRNSNTELDKNAFLTLLITQMKYQDPLNPMDDKEFVAQMAQFSALEQMQNLNTMFAYSQSISLIGKTVAGESFNEETGKYTSFAGRVDFIAMKGSEPYVVINKTQYKASDVKNVYEDYGKLDTDNAISENIFNTQNIMLVGKYVQAITFNENGEATGFVEGKVDYVKFTSGVPILVIGNLEVFPQEVISVADDYLLIDKTISIEVDTEDGGAETVTGKVSGVKIIDGKAFIQIGEYMAEIDKIDTVMEALKYVGKEIKSLNLNGIADGVFIKDKTVYLTVGDEMVKFEDIVKPQK